MATTIVCIDQSPGDDGLVPTPEDGADPLDGLVLQEIPASENAAEREQYGQSEGSRGGWASEQGLLQKGLQCPICIDFFLAPLTLPCGHTFCRACLLQSSRLAPDGRCCPECRKVINMKNPLRQPTNKRIENELSSLVPPHIFEERRQHDAKILAEITTEEERKMPVFYMSDVATRKGEEVNFFFFEPRYRVLVRRAWEGSQRFLCTRSAPQEGASGLIVEVENANFLPDGRANIKGKGVETVKLKSVWIEDGTDGLYYADSEPAPGDPYDCSAQEASIGQAIAPTSSSSSVSLTCVRPGESLTLPLFFLNDGRRALPKVKINLRLTQPRYRILANETWESSHKLFIYAVTDMRRGEEMMLVRMSRCYFEARGDAMVVGESVAVLKLGSSRQDESKSGLFYTDIVMPDLKKAKEPVNGDASNQQCCAIQ